MKTATNVNSSVGARIEEAASRLEQTLADRPYLWLVFLSLIYFAAVAAKAQLKPFWFDEIFTVYLSRLDFASLWKGLSEAVGLNPPGIYLFTKLSQKMFGGEGLIVSRIPSMLGVWIMLLCLYQFVSTRCGRLYGLAAVVFATTTAAIPYAYEARPYGLVLGFVGVAILCWQRARETRHRPLVLALLALSLAGAISLHYYTALVFAALGVAELARTWLLREID